MTGADSAEDGVARGDLHVADDLALLRTIAGFNVRMLDILMMRSLGERLAALDLTPAAVTTLLVIEANPGISHGALADALEVQRPNMTKVVNRLEAEGLVRRKAAPGDRRRISLALTPPGRKRTARALAILREHDAFALSALSSEERDLFLGLVRRVRRMLEKNGQS